MRTWILASALVALAGCTSHARTPTEEQARAALPVEVSAAREGAIAAYYSASTTLEAKQDATVVARTEGVVTEVLVEEGERVQAGQVLARLDGDRARLELERSQALIDRFRNELQRKEKMYEARLLSKEAFDQARFEYESNLAAYEMAKLNLEYARIRAPIDGVVAERLIKAGNLVSTYSPTFRITANTHLEAVLNVAQREIGTLQPGQAVNLEVRALGGSVFEGVVDRVSPTVDPDRGTFRVTVVVNDAEGRLRPGMFVRANVEYDVRENTVLAPRTAVMSEDGRTTVYVVEDGAARRREVELGYVNGTEVEVLSGLKPGDRIVTAGYASLRDGAEVRIVNA